MWIEDAHKRWKKALRVRQAEVDRQRVLLLLDATRSVADAETKLRERFALLSGATARAIAAHKGQDLDGGPLMAPSPGYAEFLTREGLDPEAPDLDSLQSRATDAYYAFLSAAAADLGEKGLLN
ncbi:hypothetical protein PUR49_01385 [Streptomyces sp. BE147]|uniref:hypothetical protein n=1 Tax=Streptomyces sp. BE147 TaxID=3002524 RepID=UPI002E79B81F|nr:hypothetical protein [Streptomyces sp. BE147]MEE1735198.1 hypothetical protein [Streptomyces sp. BE147]